MTSDQERVREAVAQMCRVILGQTTLAAAFSRVLGLDYRRIQFTPDVMPSDLTGFFIYRREEERFVYQPGCVFCNLLLADEINRTSPKAQSALLEVMEERRVTVEGVTREVPKPFLVIATENPAGSAATRNHPYIERGASPRGTIAMVKMAKASA